MSKYAFQGLASQMTEMFDFRWAADMAQYDDDEVEYDETCNAVSVGAGFTFGEQIFQYYCLKYIYDGQPTVGLLAMCQAMMDEANQQSTGHTIWKNDKARFSEGVLSLHRTKPLGWVRYFNIAEGILQLENFNTNVRTAEEYGTPDEVIKGAQVTLGLCMECAGVNPQSRSKPAAFCSQKCRVANHSRGKWKAFLSHLSKEELSEVNLPEVSQELIRSLAGKLLTHIAQGINWKTVHDQKQRPV